MSSQEPTSSPARVGLMNRLLGHRDNHWTIGAFLVAGLVILPVAAILTLAFNPEENIWPHLFDTMLPRYVANTLQLMLGVGGGVFLIGVGTAWLVTMCRFPGKRYFEWALLLPLAMPGYVVAYVYTDLLEYAGPVQSSLRALFDWQLKSDYWFPEIRTTGGAIAMLSLVLYPYVYLLTRAAFLQQSVCVLEAGRVLGRSPWQCFWSIALPMARPAIVIGMALAMMETLNDFGTIDFFGVHTLTAGVFDVWMEMGNLGGAAQISLVMLAFVIALLWIERTSRKGQRYHNTTTRYKSLKGFQLGGAANIGAALACLTPILLGFAIPAATLTYYAVMNWQQSWTPEYFTYAGNSLMLSAAAALIAVLIGLFLAYALRLGKSPALKAATRIANVGYAMPGAVLAIGVLIPFARFDNAVDAVMREHFGISTGLMLSGTAVAIIFAYSVRFLTVGMGGVESALLKVTPNMDDAARTLGERPLGVLRRVHLPMIKSGLLGGGILVFVDGMKELPATLILRPFNFDTLATFVYQFASDELLEESALGALTIVAAGILPVILLSRAIRTSRPGHSN
ncbi:ABC transporter permease [Aestuariispira insulae]|uniref:Iron(III) transport system permease protein n=1 Tax=Aestuariispira insulae TaxID=1461337 RepID=A0A3D9HJG4_9PROT|nr:iron ABC transporter permease [Aestuariispira insulae]RED49662.1 iron(III) transport system permease protein [Aestuariispira insulae]